MNVMKVEPKSGSVWDSQPHHYVLQTAVFLKIIQGKTEQAGLARVCTGSGNGAPSISALPSRSLCHGAMRGLVPHEPLTGELPLWSPQVRDGTATLLGTCLAGVGGAVCTVHLAFILAADVTLYFTRSLLVSGFISLRFASLPDLLSIRQQLFSAPAICSPLACVVGKWYKKTHGVAMTLKLL